MKAPFWYFAHSDGNYEYKIQGIDKNANKVSETSDTLSLSMLIDYAREDIPKNIKNILIIYYNSKFLFLKKLVFSQVRKTQKKCQKLFALCLL